MPAKSWTARCCDGLAGIVMCMRWQAQPSVATTFTGSAGVGSVRMARSIGGGIMAFGQYVVETYSRQQRVVALSNAKAKLYAMVAGSAETFAVMGYAGNLGMTLGGQGYMDSLAA